MPIGATHTFAQATMTTTPAVLVPTGFPNPVIANMGATTIIVGPSGVTGSSGFPIFAAQAGVSVPWNGNLALVGVALNGSMDVRYRVTLSTPGI